MKNSIYKVNDIVKHWTLNQHLGAGGNGEVWEATDINGNNVALKILKNRDAESYLFKRFTRCHYSY